MSFYVTQLGRHVTGRDTGSNKQTASKSCALSIVRQLFHLGVIEAFSGTLKKDKSSTQMAPFPVSISPDLQAKITKCLEQLNIIAVDVTNEVTDQPLSLLSSHVLDDFSASKSISSGVVPWSPPQPNWNPWIGCNIDEGYLSSATLGELSEQILQESRERLQYDQELVKSNRDREGLPVFTQRGVIMEAINDNPVIIIRGSTGCGECLKFITFIFIT